MKLTTEMKNSLPARYFGLPRKREYPMAVIIGGKAKWDKRHAALAKGRAKQQFERGFLTTTQYNRIVSKADKVLKMKQSRSMKANVKRRKNTTVQMTPDFDDPGWAKYKTKVAKKRKTLKKNLKPKTNPKKLKKEYPKDITAKYIGSYKDTVYRDGKYHTIRRYAIYYKLEKVGYANKLPGETKTEMIKRFISTLPNGMTDIKRMHKYSITHKVDTSDFFKKNTRKRKNSTVPSGSTTGGGYMLAMRGLREGDYAQKVPARQLNRQYIPVGYSSETDRDIMDTALVAGKPLKKKKKTNPSKGWFKFTLFTKSGKKLAVRIGQGTKKEANLIGKYYLGRKYKRRFIDRIVIDGPFKNKPKV